MFVNCAEVKQKQLFRRMYSGVLNAKHRLFVTEMMQIKNDAHFVMARQSTLRQIFVLFFQKNGYY
ncbi:hypothetical protein RUM_06860 [Ruminococcus champanellensis 18P13 = JCM 17042]|uniref:Uncharacterized protein n=1 Tax=Ruminococcus champanellensis (strain DSM 18848 / JCM 17042 / KCTC 15320 / 18P13) TaxID=213810 RepID=D4LB98_RUMC1|nr:hypothetical protein RUM_06860 [Ruminococcus champanellensis 18P13 = JCM 17042]